MKYHDETMEDSAATAVPTSLAGTPYRGVTRNAAKILVSFVSHPRV